MSTAYLVTGASKGLGKSIAIAIAKSGNPVIALARNSADLEEVGKQLTEIHPESITVSCDLSGVTDVFAAAELMCSQFDHLAGIVHNAGTISPIRGMLDVDGEEWSRNIRVNLIGVQNLTNRLHSIIGGDSHTRITTISSGAAKRPIHGWSSYCVSKAALDMWAMCMAEEGEDSNISALAIAPGIVDTAMQNEIRSSNEDDFPLVENFRDYHRNGDLTNPDDVAEKLLPYCLGTSGANGDRLDVRDL